MIMLIGPLFRLIIIAAMKKAAISNVSCFCSHFLMQLELMVRPWMIIRELSVNEI